MLTKEELYKTYLKYSKDITEEVFDKICNKLKQLGIPAYTVENETYRHFTNRFPYIKIDGNYQVCSSNRRYKQIQVSDILGEDWNTEDKSNTEDKPNIKFVRLSYEDWLVETKKLNLSLRMLSNHIASANTCHYDNHYIKLDGGISDDKAKILYEKWNTEDKKKSKFEIGKWYYVESYKDKIPNIIKCDELVKNYVSTENWIMLNYKQNKGEGTWELKDLTNIKEVSLEEIQEYLPDNHPDKLSNKKYTKEDLINNFKLLVYLDSEEEWNKLNEFLGFKVTSSYCGGYCYNPQHKTYDHTSSKTYPGNYYSDSIILTLNDLDIKIDKSMEEEFKVGDWVIKKEGFSSSGNVGDKNYGGMGFDNLPNSFQIEIVNENDNSVDIHGKFIFWSNNLGVYSNSVRKALPHKILKDKLLEEAKRIYPEGSYVIGCTEGVETNLQAGKKTGPISNIRLHDIGGQLKIYASPNVFLYSNGKWAEIVPKPESNFKFEIGDEVDVIKGCQICCMASLSTSIKPTLLKNKKIINRRSNKDGNWYLFDNWGNWHTEEGLVLSKELGIQKGDSWFEQLDANFIRSINYIYPITPNESFKKSSNLVPTKKVKVYK